MQVCKVGCREKVALKIAIKVANFRVEVLFIGLLVWIIEVTEQQHSIYTRRRRYVL